jgi:hypothetical protein
MGDAYSRGRYDYYKEDSTGQRNDPANIFVLVAGDE